MGIICLVTIHGIGFEQPPIKGVDGYPDTPGYADGLHEHLKDYLDASLLGDDPHRKHHGENGPIYVQSVWPPDSHCREDGLKRLGQWDKHQLRTIDGTSAVLSDGTARIAHIALVYSQAEDQGEQLGPAAITGLMALPMLGHYATTFGLISMLFADIQPLLSHHTVTGAQATNLCPRHDPGYRRHSRKHHIHHRHQQEVQQQNPSFHDVLLQLEDDVAGYICHNEMRERCAASCLTRFCAWHAVMMWMESSSTRIATARWLPQTCCMFCPRSRRRKSWRWLRQAPLCAST